MNVSRLALSAAAALLMLSCTISAAFAADSSAMDEGSSAISFRTSSPMSGEDALRLFDDAQVNRFASDALYAAFIDDNDLDIENITIGFVSVETSAAGRLKGDEVTYLSATMYSM